MLTAEYQSVCETATGNSEVCSLLGVRTQEVERVRQDIANTIKQISEGKQTLFIHRRL